MGRPLTPAELDELLGAYALDAVDDDERAQVEEWVARSPKARRDADELRETASLLTQSSVGAPDDLWSRIEARLGVVDADADVPPLRMPVVADLDVRRAEARTRRGSRPWLIAIAAAVALVVAVSVGVVVGREVSDQDARIDRLAAGMEDRAMEQAALAAAMAPGARTAQLETPDGAAMAKVVTTVDGRGYFMTDAMPELPADRTYQLWALMGEDPGSPVVSVGVLGRSPTVMAFNADAGVMGFAVTEEDAPGVAQRTRSAMLEGWLT